MLQDIGTHRFENKYKSGIKGDVNDILLYYNADKILIKRIPNQNSYTLPTLGDFPHLKSQELKFLFSVDDKNCFLLLSNLSITTEFEYENIFQMRTFEFHDLRWMGILGFQLNNWYRENQYCGKCGTLTDHKVDERALACSGCGNIIYPKLSPVVITAVTDGDYILLARGVGFRGSFFSILAGFVEIGETLEQAVAREIKEEVGVDVKNIRYYKSQPWPFSSSMMMGFVAEADRNQPIIIDPVEISEAGWFHRNNLPEYPTDVSIAGEMIAKFAKNELI